MTGGSTSLSHVAPPRRITADVRRDLDLPAVAYAPYRWAFASFVVATACVPLLLAKLWMLSGAAVVVGLVVLPAVRWFEHREASWREEVYRSGLEAKGRVIDVEPPGARRSDHTVRIEFSAGGTVVRASIFGCALARKGLMPGDDVVIFYAAERPARCIVVAKSRPEILDAVFED
jgi:hypothetical protein